ncbi:VOC family protein [Brevibacillus fluminis]|uniref:VOC family protein n=1 Tax=Brevibacillus fluminis TaxID=511487 RepID=A0A3M8DSY1_9BACL|nr:VOC family protein [Brevibacillus fluminis]RNB91290.1 VOC family protein [Brevibacillus fluminis]
MSVKVKNFAVIQLPVKNLEASIKWYQELLGIPFTFPYTPGDNEAWLNVGGVGLGLVRSPEVPHLDFCNMNGQPQPILSLQVDEIQAVYAELKEKGIDVGEMVYKKGGGYSFTFRDPDGHLSNLWGGWPSAEEDLDK